MKNKIKIWCLCNVGFVLILMIYDLLPKDSYLKQFWLSIFLQIIWLIYCYLQFDEYNEPE